MKKKIKLNLEKEIISELTPQSQSQIKGGTDSIHPVTYEGNTCVVNTCVGRTCDVICSVRFCHLLTDGCPEPISKEGVSICYCGVDL